MSLAVTAESEDHRLSKIEEQPVINLPTNDRRTTA
jgi:hypothetical protein